MGAGQSSRRGANSGALPFYTENTTPMDAIEPIESAKVDITLPAFEPSPGGAQYSAATAQATL